MIDIGEEMITAHPREIVYRHSLAGDYHNLGMVKHKQGALKQAEELYNKAIRLSEQLVDETSDIETYGEYLINHYDASGALELEKGNSDKAIAMLEKSLTLSDRLLRINPRSEQHAIRLERQIVQLAGVKRDNGMLDEAMEDFRKAIEIQQTLARTHPTNSMYRNTLADTYWRLGFVQAHLGQWESASASYAKTASLVADEPPVSTEFWRQNALLCLAVGGLGGLLQGTDAYLFRGRTDKGRRFLANRSDSCPGALSQTRQRVRSGEAVDCHELDSPG